MILTKGRINRAHGGLFYVWLHTEMLCFIHSARRYVESSDIDGVVLKWPLPIEIRQIGTTREVLTPTDVYFIPELIYFPCKWVPDDQAKMMGYTLGDVTQHTDMHLTVTRETFQWHSKHREIESHPLWHYLLIKMALDMTNFEKWSEPKV